MKAIREYKAKLDEAFMPLALFNLDTIKEQPSICENLQNWDADYFTRAYDWVKYYAPLESLKDAFEGDVPDKATLQRRLQYAEKELGTFADSIYLTTLPTNYPDIRLKRALQEIKGEQWANTLCTLLDGLKTDLNAIMASVAAYLHGLCEESGYKPQEPRKKAGRPKGRKQFLECICGDNKESVLEKLHTAANGKKGKGFALIMFVAYQQGIIERPSAGIAAEEFGDIGSKSNYNIYFPKYKSPQEATENSKSLPFTSEDIKSALRTLKRAGIDLKNTDK